MMNHPRASNLVRRPEDGLGRFDLGSLDPTLRPPTDKGRRWAANSLAPAEEAAGATSHQLGAKSLAGGFRQAGN